MGLVSGNRLNRFWKKGVKPIKDAIGVLMALSTVNKETLVGAINELAEGKFDVAKLVASTNITEPGFAMDGKTASEALTELYSKKGMTLWENSNPTAKFTTQTITLTSNNYDYAEVIHTQNGTDDAIITQIINGKSFSIMGVSNDSGAMKPSIYTRWFEPTENGLKLIAGNCSWGKEGVATQIMNAWLVPLKIIGHKF